MRTGYAPSLRQACAARAASSGGSSRETKRPSSTASIVWTEIRLSGMASSRCTPRRFHAVVFSTVTATLTYEDAGSGRLMAIRTRPDDRFAVPHESTDDRAVGGPQLLELACRRQRRTS